MKCHLKYPLIQRSLALVVSGLILLHHHIVPLPSNDAFREWRIPQHLPALICSRTHHAILHWKMATSQSFALMAQAWVRMIQWPLFKWKAHCQWYRSRVGSISLKIEQKTFIGTRGETPSRRSIFIPLQWRMRRILVTIICRWTSILQLFKCSKDNSLS